MKPCPTFVEAYIQKVKKIALGTAQFGSSYGISNLTGRPNTNEVKKILFCAQQNGITLLDTAPSYGESEKLIASFKTTNCQIITKITMPDRGEGTVLSQVVIEQFQLSLANLGLEKVYAVLLHNCFEGADESKHELVETLLDLKSKGLIEKFGFSIYSASEVDGIFKFCTPDIIQLPINIADRRLFDDGTLKNIKAYGTEIHARSAFLQGLLLMKYEDIPTYLKQKTGFFQGWEKWCKSENLSKLEASLAFLLTVSELDVVVLGTQSQLQLEECLNAMGKAQGISVPEELRIDNIDVLDPRKWAEMVSD